MEKYLVFYKEEDWHDENYLVVSSAATNKDACDKAKEHLKESKGIEKLYMIGSQPLSCIEEVK